ncbi:MAG TPA: lysine--tRNA ligase [Acetobacteraceae bacterium]|nr:lysine--tRNA ligase [Acetobacteraceae bacterium]
MSASTANSRQTAISGAWPFAEAEKLAERLAVLGKDEALFETGYGPSGLPHIGTFGEVARTSWVRLAFTELTGRPSRLIAFSDDMDGLRRVPENVPNREVLAQYLGQPLTRVPDPFGTHESFGAHNNARLRAFLDQFGFAYEFASSTEYYASGRFDPALRCVLAQWDEILAVILPTLGPERRSTYAPVLPLHPRTGRVMQVPITRIDPDAGTITWQDPEDGAWFETPVAGGHCKLQWKADWAMRWYALGVDYEMSGKDLIESVRLSGRICRILGAAPPQSFTYELFLDENGQRISKSKGNGLPIEAWLRYGPAESLAQFMFHAPERAKRLYFDVIPRATDEYLANAERQAREPAEEQRRNPAWFIHGGKLPEHGGSPIPFTMLLQLANVVNAETPEMLWGFLRRYKPEATPETMPFLDRLVRHAIAYYRDFVRPAKRFRPPTDAERAGLKALAEMLAQERPALEVTAVEERAAHLQALVYDAGRRPPFLERRKDGSEGVSLPWFAALYQVLLGQERGPRFGGFIALYGIAETIALIESVLARPADVA